MVEFAQTNVRMVPASEQLYSAIIEQRLKHLAVLCERCHHAAHGPAAA